MNPEPYAYGTRITLTPGGRHELLDAYVVDHNKTTGEYRYRCIFPYKGSAMWGNVYSSEIQETRYVDEDETARLMEVTR